MRLLLLLAPVAVCCAAHAQEAPPASAAPPQDLSHVPVIHIGPDCRPPYYPQRALEVSATGTVGLEFTVDATGHATHTEIARSSGNDPAHHALNTAAAEALALCPFTPGLNAKGEPIESKVVVSWTWKLSR